MELNRNGEPRGPPPDPLLGRLLLHYRVLEVIGQGGMSVVYRGRDEHLARDVAIKVLHPFLREKPECRTRLAREARAVARLEHPHIVKVFDFSGDRPTMNERKTAGSGHDDDENDAIRHFPDEGFIVAELVKGQTLKRHAERASLWKVPEVGAMVVWQLALALQHAHDNGVVHRDLKPENVMVRDDGVLKLMDFGIAQVRDQTGLTITGTLLGSPAHMAPECIEGLPADERSDLFSLGTVLYWLTTGYLPFEALTPHALLKQIVDGKAAPPQQKSKHISDELARVITKSLATRPEDRFTSAKEMAGALEEVIEKSGLGLRRGTSAGLNGGASSAGLNGAGLNGAGSNGGGGASGGVDDALLRRVLAAPANELPGCAARVRTAFLERAKKNLDDGATARALSCLNRVLADNGADEDARALLDRVGDDDAVHGGAGEHDGHRGENGVIIGVNGARAEITDDDARLPGPTGAGSNGTSNRAGSKDQATTTTAPMGITGERPTPLRWQTWFVGAAAVSLVFAAVVIARAVDDAATAEKTLAGGPGDIVAPDAAALVDDGTTRGEPSFADDRDSAGERGPGDGPDDDADRKRRRAGRMANLSGAGVPLQGRPVVLAEKHALPPLTAQAVPATAAIAGLTGEKRHVTFRVKPWADIVVDGTVVAKGAMIFDAQLAVGEHVVVFRNPQAKEHEQRFVVLADGPAPEVSARLDPRPALLVVRSNIKDAFVDVGGAADGQGAAKEVQKTLDRPLVVALGKESKATREVFIYKKGYVAYRKKHVFLAGETTELDVVLEPDAVDADKETPAPPVPPPG